MIVCCFCVCFEQRAAYIELVKLKDAGFTLDVVFRELAWLKEMCFLKLKFLLNRPIYH